MTLPDLTSTTETAPAFGEKGYRKGQPNPRAGTPRERLTARDAEIIAFIAKNPGADKEAISLIQAPEKNTISAGTNATISLRTAEQRLSKIHRLGATERFRNPITGTTHYGATELGAALAADLGYDLGDTFRRLEGLSTQRLRHYQMIALIAAQFVSPAEYFKDSLGLPALSIDSLISENQMRADLAKAKQTMEASGGKSFGTFRHQTLKTALESVKAGRMEWSDITSAHPSLWTIAHPRREEAQGKELIQPDLAISLDAARATPKSQSILVEIELSKKTWSEYDHALHMLKQELAQPFIYSRAVYFTAGSQVETLLKKVDTAGDYGLISSGKLVILPITHRDGSAEKSTQRVSVQAGR